MMPMYLQNKCWKRIIFPPLKGSKKHVLKCLSKITIVMQAAKTGKDTIRSMLVTNILHTNTDKLIPAKVVVFSALLNIVHTKFMAPSRDDKPMWGLHVRDTRYK